LESEDSCASKQYDQNKNGSRLGTFEALEFLELGIHGKWALWRALAAAAPRDPRLQGMDYECLTGLAEKQHSDVEQRRLEAALAALRHTTK